MHRALRLIAVAIAALPLTAQVGNEVIFAGSSSAGSTDPHHFVWSGTGATSGASSSFTDNVTDAVWNDNGRNLYVAQGLQYRVARAAWDGGAATWSTLWAAPGSCYGLGLDRFRQRLWVLTGASGSTRELHCLDVDPGSAGYGTVITQTATLGGAARERWELSPSGNLAAVPYAFIGSGLFEIVDTDPGNATYLQTIVSTFVPGNPGGFLIAADVAISIDDQYAYLLYTGVSGTTVVGGMAVLHIPSQTWLDFDTAPGPQDFVLVPAVPNVMDLALDRTFAVISGQGGGGWAGRIDFDYINPENTAFTEFLAGQGLLPNCNAASLSPQWDRVAVSATPTNQSSPSQVVVIDVNTGALLQNVTITPAWNVYTTAWQDGSPIASYEAFGTGCGGTLGVPTIAAAGASRPALGSTFTVSADNLPIDLAIMTTGFSNTNAGGVPLPRDLGAFGMPGCWQLADPVAVQFLFGASNQASWSWDIPVAEVWFGTPIYQQVFALDPGYNQVGLTASAGRAGVLGY